MPIFSSVALSPTQKGRPVIPIRVYAYYWISYVYTSGWLVGFRANFLCTSSRACTYMYVCTITNAVSQIHENPREIYQDTNWMVLWTLVAFVPNTCAYVCTLFAWVYGEDVDAVCSTWIVPSNKNCATDTIVRNEGFGRWSHILHRGKLDILQNSTKTSLISKK